jgi:hypothetical protein
MATFLNALDALPTIRLLSGQNQLAGTAIGDGAVQSVQPRSKKREARTGSRAPGFSLWSVNGSGADRQPVDLEDFLDRWLVLLFYPRDFSLI